MISVQNLCKFYGEIKAVNDISFEVQRNEIFCLLGPNGAGKTTTLEILEGLRIPDSGSAFVDGMNIVKDTKKVKEIIGVQLQTTTLFDKLTVEETIDLFASFYKKNSNKNLLKLVEMEEKKKAFVSELSGGQRQRLSIALALVNDPKLIFLDEPTTGLDPHVRRNVWNVIRNLKEEGKTIVLTTHYMEEAERLGEHVAIMDSGKIIAYGTPKELIENLGRKNAIEFTNNAEIKIENTEVKREGNSTIVYCKDLQKTLMQLLTKNIKIEEMKIRNTTLEDVFLQLTGKRIKEE